MWGADRKWGEGWQNDVRKRVQQMFLSEPKRAKSIYRCRCRHRRRRRLRRRRSCTFRLFKWKRVFSPETTTPFEVWKCNLTTEVQCHTTCCHGAYRNMKGHRLVNHLPCRFPFLLIVQYFFFFHHKSNVGQFMRTLGNKISNTDTTNERWKSI